MDLEPETRRHKSPFGHETPRLLAQVKRDTSAMGGGARVAAEEREVSLTESD